MVGKFDDFVVPGDVGVACAVDRDAVAEVQVAAADEGRVDERGAGRVQLGDEDVAVVLAAPVRLKAPVVVGKLGDCVVPPT